MNTTLLEYDTVRECRKGIEDYVLFYNQQRLHQSLKHSTPDEVYFETLTRASNE
ncbi:MAG: IS3 family transposase [Candidatus Cloacimonetes bacterium]|nr:IS3 family transposase [Candidatus Cloacimonadota bacterium]